MIVDDAPTVSRERRGDGVFLDPLWVGSGTPASRSEASTTPTEQTLICPGSCRWAAATKTGVPTCSTRGDSCKLKKMYDGRFLGVVFGG